MGEAGSERGESDQNLVRAQAGDQVAFESLYRQYAGRVYGLCLRLSADQPRAEELTQDVFVRVWEKLPSFRGESAFSSWLYRLAVNVVLGQRPPPWSSGVACRRMRPCRHPGDSCRTSRASRRST
ncbi:MAG: sigma-70 family RNA polymerase sigma factor [Gemmatimonadetes bacterium]|nr:sigma-70 family RNA polymerase sigma factor [Gemmatimonadota bacterium]